MDKLNKFYYYYVSVSNDSPSKKLFTSREKQMLYNSVLHDFPSYFVSLGNFYPEKLNAFGVNNNGGISTSMIKFYNKKLDKYKVLTEVEFFEKLNRIGLTKENTLSEAVNNLLYKDLDFDSGKNSVMSSVTLFASPLIQDAARDGMSDFFKSNNYAVNFDKKTCRVLKSDSYGVYLSINNQNKALNNFKNKELKSLFEENYKEIYGVNYVGDTASLFCTISYTDYAEKYSKFYKKGFSGHPLFMKKIYPERASELNPALVNSTPLLRNIAMSLVHKEVFENKGRTLSSYFTGSMAGRYKQFYKMLDFTSAEKFSNSIDLFLIEVERDYFYAKVKDYGIDIDFLRGQKAVGSPNILYSIPRVKAQIETKYPFLVKKGEVITSSSKINDINKAEFAQYLAKKESEMYMEALTNNDLMAIGAKYEDFGNSIAKGFVSIPLVLLISTLMIAISIINIIIKTISLFNVKNSYLWIFKLVLLFTLIFAPLFIINDKVSSEVIRNSNNPYLRHTTNWLINMQGVVNVLQMNNKFVVEFYNFTKFTSYHTAIQYDKFTGKNSEGLELKLKHDKEKFDYKY
ncbi:hypothetical protein GW891_01105 [bacterium]|nr:hypothetical protein [bacterium]